MAIEKEDKIVRGRDLEAVGAGIRKAYPRAYVGTCSTAAATAAKVVTVEEFPTDSQGKPLKGTMIAVSFSATNTAASPTLNVNGTGAARIWYSGAYYAASGKIGGWAGKHIFYMWGGTTWVYVAVNENSLAQEYSAGTSARPVYLDAGTIKPISATVGATNRPAYLDAGTPKVVESVGEAFLSWGGKNFSGTYGPIDASMIPFLGAPRTAFIKADSITAEYSRDNGETWHDMEPTDAQKLELFNKSKNYSAGAFFTIGKARSGDVAGDGYLLRIRILQRKSFLYTVLNKFAIFVSTCGSTGCNLTIRTRTTANVDNDTDIWNTVADKVSLGGWSGWNIINTNGVTFGSGATQVQEIEFTFGASGYNGNGTTNTGLQILHIMGFGGAGWTCPSYMAYSGHLYDWDYNQNALFPAAIKATSFIMQGGKATQFIKADGSVDEHTYLTREDISDSVVLGDVVEDNVTIVTT